MKVFAFMIPFLLYLKGCLDLYKKIQELSTEKSYFYFPSVWEMDCLLRFYKLVFKDEVKQSFQLLYIFALFNV